MVKKISEISYGTFQTNNSKEDAITNDTPKKLCYKMKTKIKVRL